MITVLIKYIGTKQNIQNFIQEMKPIINKIKEIPGNLTYDYYLSLDENTLLLVDSWENQEALDYHHKQDYMQTIIDLREKYDLHMQVNRYRNEEVPEYDQSFIRK